MSLLESLGIQGMNGLLGQGYLHSAQNQAFNNAYNQYGTQLGQAGLAQQQLSQYNQALGQRQETKWKFNGVDVNVRDMANAIWPTDCPEKTHFLLKYE